MKIEKVNDRQIRCTLTKNDLVSRNLKMSELAYGTDKAKNLFRDMMREAHHRFGFEVEDIPLMIEAIPISNDAIVLVITKVEDPEELDTRFSKFAPYLEDGEQQDARKKKDPGSADDIIDLFRKLKEQVEDAQNVMSASENGDSIVTTRKISAPEGGLEREVKITIQVDLTKLYSFDDVDDVISMQEGFTTPDPEEGRVKSTAFFHCQEAYILSDQSKFNIVCTYTFAPINKGFIVTDSNAPQKYRELHNTIIADLLDIQ